jgi:2-desacetyl-2-hydroxyethyl bacteriochlorophyllide A dehydrogenase
MNALIFDGPGNIGIRDLNIPQLQPDELLIQVNGCGVCGTDFHIYEGNAPSKIPVVLGHEYCGTVTEMGKDVADFSIGDNIAINPNIHCGYCEFCRKGEINLCVNLKALGVTINGGMSQYSVVPITQAHLLPKDFPFSQAIFAEPLSCCIHGINRSEIRIGDKVVIVGAGTIGLIMVQLAKMQGASSIIVIDPLKSKREMAKSLGSDYVFNSNESDNSELINDFTSGGADVVIECVGSQSAVESAIRLVKKGGKVVIFGLSDKKAVMKISLQSFFHKELTIIGSILNPNNFQAAVDILINKKINVEIFNPFPLLLEEDKIKSLFNGLLDETVIKFMVTPNS